MTDETKKYLTRSDSKCLTCIDAVLIEAWNPEQGNHSEAFCGITGQKIELAAIIKKCNRYDSTPKLK